MMVTLPPTPPPIPQALLDAHLPSVAPAAGLTLAAAYGSPGL